MLVSPVKPIRLEKLTIKIPQELNQTLNQYIESVIDKSGAKITVDEVVSQLLTYAIEKDSEFKRLQKEKKRTHRSTTELSPNF